jgi:hypothetical protein
MLWMGFVIAVSIGCRVESSPLSQANLEMSSVAPTKYPPIQVDLGIIFDDEEVYACFPLARFNLDSNDSIESVNTSCDCVSLSLLGYLDSKSDTKRALRIDVSPSADTMDHRSNMSMLRIV